MLDNPEAFQTLSVKLIVAGFVVVGGVYAAVDAGIFSFPFAS